MVDDPAKTTPAKLTNYHVNRIQVNCYSSEANESPASLTNSLPASRANSLANSLTNTLTNGSTLCGSSDSNAVDSSNGSSSPTHSTASSSSSRLFFVDQKLNQPNGANQSNNQTANQFAKQRDEQCRPDRPGSQLAVQNESPIQRAASAAGSARKKTARQADDAKLATKSIYSEQSLKKQIHQFKERQQNQLRYYSSSTSSSASSTASSKQYLSSKRHLIEKHLSDKALSESEPPSSLNYSLNYSNCSTTDTLLTKSTLRSTGKRRLE